MHLSYSSKKRFHDSKFCSTCYFKAFSDESSCEVEIEKTILVLNSNENGTVEISDVRLILPPLAICGGTNCTAKT